MPHHDHSEHERDRRNRDRGDRHHHRHDRERWREEWHQRMREHWGPRSWDADPDHSEPPPWPPHPGQPGAPPQWPPHSPGFRRAWRLRAMLWHDPRWAHAMPPEEWRERLRDWRGRQRFLFARFVGVFGVMAALIIAGMVVAAFVLSRLLGGDPRMAVLTWIVGCSLSLALPLLAVALAVYAFRDITGPLADIMHAADAIAAGDLGVRVEERGPGEFWRLAVTFNRMTSELQRIDEQRRNLTADVAHELRTPLHVIQGNLEGILDGVYQPTPEHITMLLEETHLLSRLVEDLRTLSLAESGHLLLREERVDVAELLTDVGTSFGGQAEAAGITLRVVSEGLNGAAIRADVVRMNQVFGNLLTNALRHTPDGGAITVAAARFDEGVRFSVADTGSGIAPEDLPHIFDRFWRGDPARTHADGAGGGLGLAIVRQLVQLHGGHVEARSEVGRGTTFTITLPATDL